MAALTRLTHRLRPRWTRPFVDEPAPKLDIQQPISPPYAAISLAVLSLLGLGLQIVTTLYLLPRDIALAVLWTLSIILLALTAPRTTPYAVLSCYLAIITTQAIDLSIAWQTWRVSWSLHTVCASMSTLLAVVAVVIIINMPLRNPRLPNDSISKPYTQPSHELRSPEDNLTLWQWSTVAWLSPLLTVCRQRQLQNEDVWHLPYTFQHRRLFDAFAQIKGSVFWRVLVSNREDIFILMALGMLELAAKYAVPVMLQPLLRSMENLQINKRPAIVLTFAILAIKVIKTQSEIFSMWYGRRAYERSRGEMIAMVYDKALRRQLIGASTDHVEGNKTTKSSEPPTAAAIAVESHQRNEAVVDESAPLLQDLSSPQPTTPATLLQRIMARCTAVLRILWPALFIDEETKKMPSNTGKLFNVMKNDAYEVAQRLWDIQDIVQKPIGLAVSLSLVYRFLGWSCLVGVAFSLVIQAINLSLAAILVVYTKVRKDATDKKLQKVKQYVDALRHLRWYGWHHKWMRDVNEARQNELNKILITRGITTLIWVFNIWGTFSMPVVCFWAYTSLAGNTLTIDVAFPALELLYFLQDDLRNLPDLIEMWFTSRVSLDRLETFMAEPDVVNIDIGDDLRLEKATFAWPGKLEPVLRDVSLTFPVGVTVISGRIGAGKSALIQGLLNELDLLSGELIKPKRAIAYCQQTPWLQSMTLRDNILFGCSYDDARYKQVLDACALTADFAQMAGGDLTSVGEKGVRLSGGQKARTTLARAIYSQAPFLLLDDPLSALDQETAETVVRKCFQGPLAEGRTIILVTHRADLFKDFAAQLVQVENGEVRVISDEERLQSGPWNSSTPESAQDDEDDDETTTKTKEEQERAAIKADYVDEEKRKEGSAPLSLYWTYIKAGSLMAWAVVIIGALLYRFVRVLEIWLLKEWTEAYKRGTDYEAGSALYTTQLFTHRMPGLHTLKTDSSTPISRLFDRLPNPGDNVNPWLIAYMVVIFGFAFAQMLTELSVMVIMYKAGKRLFENVLQQISGSTFRYYDITPEGRIHTRMTADMNTVDGQVARQIHLLGFFFVACVASVIVIAFVTWYFFILSALLTIAFVLVYNQYISTSQSLRRLEMVNLAPLLDNLGILADGLVTIRAFREQDSFMEKNIQSIDVFQGSDHFYWSAQAWLSIRYGMLASLSTAMLTLLAIGANLSVGLTAFVLITSDKFVSMVHYCCRTYGELQMSMVAVERVVDVQTDVEEKGDVLPPAHWPTTNDDIVFDNVTLSYAQELDPVLKNISFTLKGGSTTALIGRTGSGKSTLVMALLATVMPDSGRVTIGGVDLARVDKQSLRSRITYIAQDPVLFEGTMRHNMDPNGDFCDDACENVIARVGAAFKWTSDTKIVSGGKNLSQGQRQLVGLARAVLRRSTILLMDEATASFDQQTADEILRVLREEMKGSTILTIAHRPDAVVGATWCLQLANGELINQGRPDEILPNMRSRAGESSEEASSQRS